MYELIFALKHIHLSKRGKRVGGGGAKYQTIIYLHRIKIYGVSAFNASKS